MNQKNLGLFIFFFASLAVSMIPQDAAAQLNFGFSSATNTQTQQDFSIKTVGLNYNNTYDPTTKKGSWISHPDYLLNYLDWQNKPVYTPYQLDNSSGYVTFSTNRNSITLYRDTCTVKLYNGGKIQSDSIPLTTISFDLQRAQNATDNWYDSPVNSQACIISYTQIPNQVTFDMIQSIPNSATKDIRFIFNLAGNPEAILSVTNNNQTDTQTKYGFAVTLNNIFAAQVTNQTLTPQNTTQTIQYTNLTNNLLTVNGSNTELKFDTQNSINHYLWAAKVEPTQGALNLILDYKNAPNALPPNQTLSIDPTWTSVLGSASRAVIGDPAYNNNCGSTGSPAIKTGSQQIVTPATTVNTYGCQEFPSRWTLSGFPINTVVNSVTLQFDVSYISNPKNCDFTQYTTDPNGQSAAQIISYMSGATRYVANTSLCTTIGNAKQVSLGSQAVTDFRNQIALGWFAVGFTFNDYRSDASSTNEDDLINNYIIVSYTWNPPAPITTLSCNDNAINSVNCNWSAPTSTDSIVGYYVTKNTTLNAPLYLNSLYDYYKLDYNDPQYGIVNSGSRLLNGTMGAGSFSQLTGQIGYSNNFTGSSYVTVGTTSSFAYLQDGSTPWTISFWMKPKINPPPCCGQLIDTSGFGNNAGIYMTWNGRQLYYVISNSTPQTIVFPVCNSYPSDTNWHFVTFTYNPNLASNNGQVWLDGSLCAQATKTGNTPTGSNSYGALAIGAATGGGSYFKGQIDDLRFYKGLSMSASQISSLYNYRLISSTSYTDTSGFYPQTYNYNVYGLSDKGQIQQVLGNTVQIAPYNVIDPPFKANATLASDSQGFYENLQWTPPKVANSICGSLCSPNGYQVQQYNTTSHSWQILSTNQTATTYKDRNIMQNQTQQIRLLTSNYGGWSTYTQPLNQTTYPQEVSHWFLQNNLVDSRNLANATLTGTWNFTTGRNGNAQYFDGNTYDAFASGIFNLALNTPFTFTAWEKTSNCSTSPEIAEFQGGGHLLYITSTSIGYQIRTSGSGGNLVSSGVTPCDGNWHFISWTYDGSSNQNGMKEYHDGSLIGTGSSSAFTGTINTGSSTFGIDNNLSSNPLTGFVSDARLFKTNLTAPQITDLYNGAIASRQNYAGTLSITNSVVGNVMGINGTLTTSAGFPQTANLTNYKLVNASNSNAVLQTHTTNTRTPITLTIPEMWNVTSIASPYNYYENVTVQASQGNVIVKSNTQSIKGLFNPSYVNVPNATTPNWYGQAYRTNNGNNVILKLNGNPITFTTTCTMQSSATPNDSISISYNNVGFVNGNFSNFPSRNTVYGQCTDAPVIVFKFTLQGNQTGAAGFLVFGDVLGATSFFGVSWVFLIVLLIASTVTAKHSVIGIIATVGMLGILTTLGMINNFSTLIWSLIILLAALGVFMGKKALFD